VAQKRHDPEVGKDVNRRYMVGGVWHRRVIDKQGKGRSERTKLGRLYVAIPPAAGWPGGQPSDNGWRAGKG
jgi:hypothetical protein